MRRALGRLTRLPVLIGLMLVAAAMLWTSIASSDVLSWFRPEPSTDPARLRGRTLPLAGIAAFGDGRPVALADLPRPLLLCRLQTPSGRWALEALPRAFAAAQVRPAVLLVFAAGEDATWAERAFPDGAGVVVDGPTMAAWGFRPHRPDIRVIGSDGAVASGNLAGNDRDDTIELIAEALRAQARGP